MPACRLGGKRSSGPARRALLRLQVSDLAHQRVAQSGRLVRGKNQCARRLDHFAGSAISPITRWKYHPPADSARFTTDVAPDSLLSPWAVRVRNTLSSSPSRPELSIEIGELSSQNKNLPKQPQAKAVFGANQRRELDSMWLQACCQSSKVLSRGISSRPMLAAQMATVHVANHDLRA